MSFNIKRCRPQKSYSIPSLGHLSWKLSLENTKGLRPKTIIWNRITSGVGSKEQWEGNIIRRVTFRETVRDCRRRRAVTWLSCRGLGLICAGNMQEEKSQQELEGAILSWMQVWSAARLIKVLLGRLSIRFKSESGCLGNSSSLMVIGKLQVRLKRIK